MAKRWKVDADVLREELLRARARAIKKAQRVMFWDYYGEVFIRLSAVVLLGFALERSYTLAGWWAPVWCVGVAAAWGQAFGSWGRFHEWRVRRYVVRRGVPD